MKFSEIVTALVETWLDWMKHNTIARSESYDMKTRRASAERCEDLIRREYELVEKMDAFFPSRDGAQV